MKSSRQLGGSANAQSSSGIKPAQSYRDQPVRDDGESVFAMSLHSNIGQFFDDEDDAPNNDELPPYTDTPIGNLTSAYHPVPQVGITPEPEDIPAIPEGFQLHSSEVIQLVHADKKGSTKYILSNKHTSDPAALEWAIRDQVNHPPAAYIRIHGEHTEKRYDSSKKKTESHTVVDFDTKIDISAMHDSRGMSPKEEEDDGQPPTPASKRNWMSIYVVENEQKTYRGGIIKSLNKTNNHRRDHVGFGDNNEDVERLHQPTAEEVSCHAPSLTEWCHLFCASHYSMKTFEVRHQVSGRDDSALTRRIEEYVRATNYRGRITVSFELCPRALVFQTKHKLNVARHNKWIWWLCVLLQLWIITWPILFLTTKRWSVVTINWDTWRCKRRPRDHPEYEVTMPIVHCHMSEAAFAEKWRYSIQQAALNKRIDGGVLSYAGNGEEEARALAENEARAARRSASEPEGGFVGSVLGLARGLGNIARERDNARGWGYDE